MTATEEAIQILKVTEGNIISQWACSGREVFEPYTAWLAEVRRVIALLEDELAAARNDFNAMTDAQIDDETRRMEDQLNEAEEWIEAVCAWQADGSPRTMDTSQ